MFHVFSLFTTRAFLPGDRDSSSSSGSGERERGKKEKEIRREEIERSLEVEVEKDLSQKKKKKKFSTFLSLSLFSQFTPRATHSPVASFFLFPACESASTRLVENRTSNAHREAR